MASKVSPTTEPPRPHQRQRRHRQRLVRVGGDVQRGRHVLPGRVEETAAEAARRGEADRVHHPVEAVDVLADPVGEAGQLLRRRSRRARSPGPARAAAWRSARPARAGRSRSARPSRRSPGRASPPRRRSTVGDHAGDEQPLTGQQSRQDGAPLRSWKLMGERSVAHAEAAVDRDHRAGDVTGAVAGEPGHHGRRPRRWRRTGPAGIALRISALRSSGSAAVMSVSMKPGATTLAVMLRLPSSRVIERATPTRPALLAA